MQLYLLLILFCAICVIANYHYKERAIKFALNYSTKQEQKYFENVLLILVIIMMLLISSLRGISVGADTINYKLYYDISFEFGSTGFEMGFETIMLICKYIGLSYNGYLMVIALIMFVPLLFFLKRFSIDPLLSLFLYITLGIFSMSFNGVRQFIAFTIFICSIKFIVEKNFLGYLVGIFIAYLFHSSAIILVPIYFLRYIKPNWIVFFILFVAFTVTSFFLKDIVLIISNITKINYYERYFVQNDLSQSMDFFNIFYCFALLAFFTIMYVLKNRIYKVYSKIKVEYNLFLFLMFIFLNIRTVATFSGIFSLVNRLSMYFQFSLIILVPYFFSALKKSWLNYIFQFLCLTCGSCYFILSACIRKSNEIYPYVLFNESLILHIILCLIFITFIFCVIGFIVVKENRINFKIKNKEFFKKR